MKSIEAIYKYLSVFLLLVAFNTAANATINPSVYLGWDVGYVDTNFSGGDLDGITTADVDDTGLGGRLFLGYLYNENFAIEGGYTYFPDTDFNNIDGGIEDGRIKMSQWDISIKGIWPIKYDIGIYGVLGFVFIDPKTTGALPSLEGEYNLRYGAGISYDILPNLVIDFSYVRTGSSGDIQDTELLSIGIAYYIEVPWGG